MFKPRSPTQGESCASWMVCLSRFKPCAGLRTGGLFWALLFVVVARQISSHLSMEQLSQIIVCEGYSFAMVENEGLMESPQSTSSIHIVGCQLGNQQCRQNGRLVGAIESASGFNGASEVAVKTKILFNLIASTY